MEFYPLVLAVLGVWRVTHLLHAEDGPWQLLLRFRRLAGAGVLGEMLDCFYCASIWVAAPFAWAVGGDLRERLLLWPALSAGAILLERLTVRDAAPAAYHIEEDQDVLLRKEADPK